jgi:hypothetical protein
MALQADRVLLEQVGRQAGGAAQPQLQRQAPGTQAKAESSGFRQANSTAAFAALTPKQALGKPKSDTSGCEVFGMEA